LLGEDLADRGTLVRIAEREDERPAAERHAPRGSGDGEDADQRRDEGEKDTEQGQDLEAARQRRLELGHRRLGGVDDAGERLTPAPDRTASITVTPPGPPRPGRPSCRRRRTASPGPSSVAARSRAGR